ncbi:hypothetical protein [Saccharothrix longispora]|uniref:hypothetical protein n=1 Tax=Saccharothrix longispora TaxID=33920 RepID=UPI0028FD5D03|nr:hypothetical protein [Saccharothrix longispora]MDU0288840.1 hypothetical protein [Saccharothrix longispora]
MSTRRPLKAALGAVVVLSPVIRPTGTATAADVLRCDTSVSQRFLKPFAGAAGKD